MTQPLEIIETFKVRQSARTFNGKNFPQNKMQKVQEIINEVNQLETPFKLNHVEIAVTKPGLGKMGFISNETGWIVEKIKKNSESKESPTKEEIIDASFRMQIAVMKMTQNHITTVWIGGTYNRGKAAKRYNNEYHVPIGVAFGDKEAPHFMAKVVKLFKNSRERLPFEKLFYDSKRNQVVDETLLNSYNSKTKDFIESLRSGPSSMNGQPWRFALFFNDDDGEQEMITHVNLYNAASDDFSSFFSMGIALGNVYFMKEVLNNQFEVSVKNPTPSPTPVGGDYVCTITI
ncbi:hypothetical protein TRFO_02993 [Tritrichomonas foetus]|uniref:Putative nitroreductase TM1586 domain-containing protein n=1 Tax=Tritrichomonas foetus TaxID=1144522 RepID=A0A1J4KYF1_9EUKA|nr:hypothetical protein TRFO_02993 [Tritrichomonas foetus]|eukprot:OHT14734.1 hypothetical protein TRFO_02993 [Tritrichomonas foetus]